MEIIVYNFYELQLYVLIKIIICICIIISQKIFFVFLQCDGKFFDIINIVVDRNLKGYYIVVGEELQLKG